MTKRSAIFKEIENRLTKDDYASKLPVYHPAKGRRKRVKMDDQSAYLANDSVYQQPNEPHNTAGVTNFQGNSEESFPGVPPEIEMPDKKEIFPPSPGEREIDPERDLPHRDIPHPDEEEMPGGDPAPEIEDPGKKR